MDLDRPPLVERITRFMGMEPTDLQVVNEEFRPFEHATVQIAIDGLLARPGVSHELIGVGGMARSHQAFSEILAMDRHSRMFSVGTVDYASVPVSVDEELTCVRFGIYLIDEGEQRLVVLLRDQMEGPRGSTSMLEVLAASIDGARTWLAFLREERVACNTLRGQVLSFEPSEFSPGAGPAIRFVAEACALTRTLQPSLIVLEDCDLVAEDRSFSSTGQPLLFTLLDEMDGLGADVDVSFLLTTNRVDLLETALAGAAGVGPAAADEAVTTASSGWFAYGPTALHRHVRR